MMQKTIIKRLRTYFEKDEALAFVLLFGSHATGEVHSHSDIDIGLFFEGEPDYVQAGYHQAKLESVCDRRADVTVLNDLPKRDPLFAFNILQHHRIVVCRDEDRYVRFKTEAQLYYLDHLPLIQANRDALQKRLRDPRTIGERHYA